MHVQKQIRSNLKVIMKATPHNYRLTPMMRICLHLFRQPSQISSAEKSLLPPQLVLSDEKTGGELYNNPCAVLPEILPLSIQ